MSLTVTNLSHLEHDLEKGWSSSMCHAGNVVFVVNTICYNVEVAACLCWRFQGNGEVRAGMQTLHWLKLPGEKHWWKMMNRAKQQSYFSRVAHVQNLHVTKACIKLTLCSNSFALLLFPNNVQRNLHKPTCSCRLLTIAININQLSPFSTWHRHNSL